MCAFGLQRATRSVRIVTLVARQQLPLLQLLLPVSNTGVCVRLFVVAVDGWILLLFYTSIRCLYETPSVPSYYSFAHSLFRPCVYWSIGFVPESIGRLEIPECFLFTPSFRAPLFFFFFFFQQAFSFFFFLFRC